MRMPSFARDTVTIIGVSGFDQYGDPTDPTTSDITVNHCLVVPRTSTEPGVQARNGVVIGLMVYMPAGTPINAHNRLRINGVVYEVEGEPGHWPVHLGRLSVTGVAVKRAEG